MDQNQSNDRDNNITKYKGSDKVEPPEDADGNKGTMPRQSIRGTEERESVNREAQSMTFSRKVLPAPDMGHEYCGYPELHYSTGTRDPRASDREATPHTHHPMYLQPQGGMPPRHMFHPPVPPHHHHYHHSQHQGQVPPPSSNSYVNWDELRSQDSLRHHEMLSRNAMPYPGAHGMMMGSKGTYPMGPLATSRPYSQGNSAVPIHLAMASVGADMADTHMMTSSPVPNHSRESFTDNSPQANNAGSSGGLVVPKESLRRGRWTAEEETYACSIIRNFERGLLNISPGTSLRNFLAEKLHCDPMRITKKFAGDSSVGKRVFHPCPRTAEKLQEMNMVMRELAEHERLFLNRLNRRKNGRASIPAPSAVESIHEFSSQGMPPKTGAIGDGSSTQNFDLSINSPPPSSLSSSFSDDRQTEDQLPLRTSAYGTSSFISTSTHSPTTSLSSLSYSSTASTTAADSNTTDAIDYISTQDSTVSTPANSLSRTSTRAHTLEEMSHQQSLDEHKREQQSKATKGSTRIINDSFSDSNGVFSSIKNELSVGANICQHDQRLSWTDGMQSTEDGDGDEDSTRRTMDKSGRNDPKDAEQDADLLLGFFKEASAATAAASADSDTLGEGRKDKGRTWSDVDMVGSRLNDDDDGSDGIQRKRRNSEGSSNNFDATSVSAIVTG